MTTAKHSNPGIPANRVVLRVNRYAFDEIKGTIEDAKYFGSIHNGGKTLDMRGLALEAADSVPEDLEDDTLP